MAMEMVVRVVLRVRGTWQDHGVAFYSIGARLFTTVKYNKSVESAPWGRGQCYRYTYLVKVTYYYAQKKCNFMLTYLMQGYYLKTEAHKQAAIIQVDARLHNHKMWTY